MKPPNFARLQVLASAARLRPARCHRWQYLDVGAFGRLNDARHAGIHSFCVTIAAVSFPKWPGRSEPPISIADRYRTIKMLKGS